MTTDSTTRPAPDDQDVRDALSALRAARPEAHEVATLRRRLATAAPAHRTRRRTLGAIATATAAVGVGIALLPATDDPGSRSSSPLGSLATPSALASEVPPVRDGPFRYARVRDVTTYVSRQGDRTGTLRSQQTAESWVSAGWKGRERTIQGPVTITGDASLSRRIAGTFRPAGTPTDGPFLYGDGPLATLDPAELPTDRDAISAALRDGIRTNRWAAEGRGAGQPRRSGSASDDAFVGYSIVGLLVNARLTTQQRAAFLDVLRTDPHARSRGIGTDADGRRGQILDLDYPGEQTLLGVRGLRVITDPQRDEILEWSTVPTPAPDGGASTTTTETVLRSAYVGSETARP
ncbi:hypothetical protein [Patulibacter minatonensis]|uniref:hypothetical protein n=1 Tax=Patulibacter minatonensis TaxID=298163 RepID=UPI00047D852E|nr:hypothetical protein [Patulibacter minatonensis]